MNTYHPWAHQVSNRKNGKKSEVDCTSLSIWSQDNLCAILHSFNFNVEQSKINVPAPQASHLQPYKKGRKRVHEEIQVTVKFIAPVGAFTHLHHCIPMHHRTPISCKRYKPQTCSYHRNRLKW